MAEECVYYYYDSGYCCKLKREKTGNSSVDSDDVKRYCWGYNYDDCPIYKSRNSSGGCFISSACTEAKGLPDNCRELSVLRAFRDGYLRGLPEGEKEIEEYYRIAPPIVAAIRRKGNSLAIFEEIYEKLVKPCADMIERGENEAAHRLYRECVQALCRTFLADKI